VLHVSVCFHLQSHQETVPIQIFIDFVENRGKSMGRITFITPVGEEWEAYPVSRSLLREGGFVNICKLGRIVCGFAGD
jgi:hypothetical protein